MVLRKGWFGLFLVLTLSGCNATKGLKFGSCLMTMNNPYFVTLNNGIKAIVEANGDKLVTLDPALDQQRQIAEVRDLVEQHVAAIFLAPVDWKAVKPALELAAAAHIPVINVDAPVFDTQLVACVIASDNYKAGVLVAQDVLKRRHSANVVLLEHPTAKSGIDRTQSFVDITKDNLNIRIIARASSNGQLEEAMPVMQKIIESHPKIDVVMGLNDPTAMGALAALQAAHRDHGVLIYGVDGAPDAKKLIREGRMTATAAQSPISVGKTAAETAFRVLHGEKVPRQILIPVVLIDKSNVDQYGVNGWQ